ncbi:glycosyltransferase family 39 protein [Candidatus Woesearchaeota archaeon]|nr:glycosyltransferase family 39 protein [Candidatus Woesearchaeota archaeon]
MKENIAWIAASAGGGILFYIYCLLLGTKIFKFWTKKTKTESTETGEQFFISVSLGIGVVALLLLLLGIAKSYTPFLMSIFFILTTGIAVTEYKTLFTYFKEAAAWLREKKKESVIYTIAKYCMLLLLIFYFVVALSPETEWDAISFHLVTAKVYVREQAMVPIYYTYHAALPHLFDMLYVVGELVKSDVLSRVFVLCVDLTIVFGIWMFGKKMFSEEAGILAALIFMTTPVLMVYFPATYVDIPISIFALSAIGCFWQWKQTNKKAWLFLSVLNAGFAATAKISTAPLIGALFVLYIWHARKQEEKGMQMLKTILICGCILGLLFLPWFTFNAVHFNNPVYPFAEGIFEGKYWNEELAVWWKNQRDHYNTGEGVLQYGFIPFTLTFMPNLTGPIYGFSPFYLMFIPILWILKKIKEEREKTVFLSVLAVICMTGWFILAPDMRYMFYILPLFAILAGAGITKVYKVYENKRRKKRIVTICILFILLSNIFFFFVIFRNDVKMWAGIISRDEYKAIDTLNYYAAQWANENLPEDAIIFLANDDKGYYFEREFITGYGVFSAYVDYPQLKDGEALYQRLKELGVTHVLFRVYEDGSMLGYEEYYNDHTTALFKELTQEYATTLYTENNCTIYVLN